MTGVQTGALPLSVSTFFNINSHEEGMTKLDHQRVYLYANLVGFAGRGEKAAGAAPGPADPLATPPPLHQKTAPTPPPTQVQTGEYQLEIRRGTEYGSPDPITGVVTLYGNYDVRDNLAPDDRDVINDNFETNNFTALPWVNNSPSRWTITNTANGTGTYS